MIQYSKTAFKTMILSALLTIMPIQNSYAAPGVMPDAPLFLSNSVEPNIFLTLDDSGSMEINLMVQDGTAGFTTYGGIPYKFYGCPTCWFQWSSAYMSFWHPSWAHPLKNDYFIAVPPSTNVDPVNYPDWVDTWVLRTHHGNPLYYNPATTYVPWAGTKADGTAMFTNAVETAVLADPNDPSGDTVDLTDWLDYSFTANILGSIYNYPNSLYLPSYYVWNDDGNGVLETTDGNTLVIIPAGSAQMQNFANWFQYYRSRMHATKAAIGRTIDDTKAARMGLDVYNAGHKKNLESMSDDAKETRSAHRVL